MKTIYKIVLATMLIVALSFTAMIGVVAEEPENEDVVDVEVPVLEVGTNSCTIPAEGVYYNVYATEQGTYTITGDGVTISENTFVVTYAPQTLSFNVTPVAGEEITTDIVVEYSEELPIDNQNFLEIGENVDVVIPGNGAEFYVFATAPGVYTVTGEGVLVGINTPYGADYETNYLVAENAYENLCFVIIPEVLFEEVTTTLTVTYSEEIPSPDTRFLEVGLNEGVAVNGWGEYFTVVATELGFYTVTGEGIVVYAVDENGNMDSEFPYVEATYANQILQFLIGTESWEDAVVDLTVVIEEDVVRPQNFLVVGENLDQEISGWGTDYYIIAEAPGTYTVTGGENLVVAVVNLIGDLDFEVNYAVAEYANESLHFLLSTADWEDAVMDITVTYSEEIPNPDQKFLEIGLNEGVEISGFGSDYYVFAEAEGSYSITGGESLVVGVVNLLGDIDYDTGYAVAENAMKTLHFILATKDFEDAVMDITVVYSEEIPSPDATFLEVGVNENVTIPGYGGGHFIVVAPTPGAYTVSANGVVVGVVTEYGVDFETATAIATYMNESLYFFMYSEDLEEIVADVTVEYSEYVSDAIILGEGAHELVIPADGVIIQVFTWEAGTYTITGEGIAVGILDENGDPNYEISSITVSSAKQTISFVVGTVSFEEETVTLTVSCEQTVVDQIMLDPGLNEGVSVPATGATYTVYCMIPGVYSVSGEGVVVGIIEENGTINYEVNSIAVYNAYQNIDFVIYSESGEDVVVDLTVEVGDLPIVEVPELVIGVNEDVSVGAWGTEYFVFAQETGAYYITGEGVSVGFLNENGDIDYETGYAVAEHVYQNIFFILASEDLEDLVTTITITVGEVPPKDQEFLVVGENEDKVVDALGSDYYVFAEEEGRYYITGEGVVVGVINDNGDVDYEIGYADAEHAYKNLHFVVAPVDGETVVVTLTVSVTEIPNPDQNFLEIGENEECVVNGDGVDYYVFATEEGAYYISGEGVVVGVVDLLGNIDYETGYAVAEHAFETLHFVVATENWEDAVVTLTVKVEPIPVDVQNFLEIGENAEVAVSAWGTEFVVVATEIGTYTVSGEGVVVGVMNENGDIDYETNSIVAEYAFQNLHFVAYSENGEDIVATLTVAVGPIEGGDENFLVVGENADVAVSAWGTHFTVVAEEAGVYTVSGEGVVVGIVTEDGVDYEVNSLTAEYAFQNLYFVAYSENEEDVVTTLVVTVSEIPAPVKVVLNVGENADIEVAVGGTIVYVVADKKGTYSIVGEGIVVGIVTEDGVNYEVSSIDANVGEEIAFVVAPEEFENIVTTLTVTYEKGPDTGDKGILFVVILALAALTAGVIICKKRVSAK